MEEVLTLLIVGFMLCSSTVVLLGIAAFLYFNTKKFLSTAQQTTGTVVELKARSSSKGGTVYAPVYEYILPDGRVFSSSTSSASNPPRYQVGQTIEVLYDPQNPQSARINDTMNLYFTPALLAGVALFVGFSGGGAILFELVRAFFSM